MLTAAAVFTAGRTLLQFHQSQREIEIYLIQLEKRHQEFESKKQSREITLSPEYLSHVSPEVVSLLRILPRTQSGISAEDQERQRIAINELQQKWSPSYVPMLAEMIRVAPELGNDLYSLLEERTGQKFGRDINAWLRWSWNNVPDVHPNYMEFKHHLYAQIDLEFSHYYASSPKSQIRADEIVWGGVMLGDIPLLDHPQSIPATEAKWLGDQHIVFGIEIQGESRAYPRRIAAHHELIQDQLGGTEIVCPYCTMCESINVYESTSGGTAHDLRTSGFLYRANKLMYDVKTHSLWSSIGGKPVVGPLTGQDSYQLKRHPVVTTTWLDWRNSHPQTTVLSIDTGFSNLDYQEGVAYADFAASKKLWYPVLLDDDRLPDKQEVLVIPSDNPKITPVAIDVRHLREHPVLSAHQDSRGILVITDAGGGSRAYATPRQSYHTEVVNQTITDETGRVWNVTDGALTSPGAESCPRLPTHRIYWLAWVNHHPDTVLLP